MGIKKKNKRGEERKEKEQVELEEAQQLIDTLSSSRAITSGQHQQQRSSVPANTQDSTNRRGDSDDYHTNNSQSSILSPPHIIKNELVKNDNAAAANQQDNDATIRGDGINANESYASIGEFTVDQGDNVDLYTNVAHNRVNRIDVDEMNLAVIPSAANNVDSSSHAHQQQHHSILYQITCQSCLTKSQKTIHKESHLLSPKERKHNMTRRSHKYCSSYTAINTNRDLLLYDCLDTSTTTREYEKEMIALLKRNNVLKGLYSQVWWIVKQLRSDCGALSFGDGDENNDVATTTATTTTDVVDNTINEDQATVDTIGNNNNNNNKNQLGKSNSSGSGSRSSEKKKKKKDTNTTTTTTTKFITSSLARHLARHCQLLRSEEDVVDWCMKNVRVQTQEEFGEC